MSKEWWSQFMERHGERLVFMFLAMGFCVVFIGLSYISVPEQKGPTSQLIGSAVTILIGLAMLCFNKARGDVNMPEKKELTKTKEIP